MIFKTNLGLFVELDKMIFDPKPTMPGFIVYDRHGNKVDELPKVSFRGLDDYINTGFSGRNKAMQP